MKINNKEYPTKMGLNQSILYCELRDISITQMNEEFSNFATGKYTGSEIRDLIWSALKDGARFNKAEFEHSNLDVGDWMENLEEGEMERFMEELGSSMPKTKSTAIKKKVVKK